MFNICKIFCKKQNVEKVEKEKFSDKIWFTRKARIQTTIRLKNNHTHSQLLLVWYTLIGAILSVIVLKYDKFLGNDTGVLLAIISIFILVLSLVITNFNMKERSERFYKNHIQLQDLYDKAKDLEIASEEGEVIDYGDIKLNYQKLQDSINESHTNLDDICARVENSAGLTTRKTTKLEHVKCFLYTNLRRLILILMYASPFVAYGIFK